MKKRNFYIPFFALIAAAMLVLLFALMPRDKTEKPAKNTAVYTENTEKTSAETVISATVTTPAETAPSSAVPNDTAPEQTAPAQTTAPQSGAVRSVENPAEKKQTEDVRLEYGKGNTWFSASEDNRFIKHISEERNIPASDLVSVYSLPDEGLNYVLEFNGGRAYGNLRRVYLIDADGNTASVAAADPSECENVSQAENTVCMKVLIKQGIFPCIEDLLGSEG